MFSCPCYFIINNISPSVSVTLQGISESKDGTIKHSFFVIFLLNKSTLKTILPVSSDHMTS